MKKQQQQVVFGYLPSALTFLLDTSSVSSSVHLGKALASRINHNYRITTTTTTARGDGETNWFSSLIIKRS